MRKLIVPSVLVVFAACSDSAPPPPPSEVAAVGAIALPAAVVGTTLATAPTFEVRAENGRALRVPVTVQVTSGGGTLAEAPTRSLRGPTPIGQWTLGTTAGPQTVTVSVPELPPLVFTVEAQAATASVMEKVGGTGLRGPASAVMAVPVEVRITDSFGNGVAGQTVTWTVQAGGGSVAATTSATNAQGVATAPAWTLGATGAQQLRATAGTLTQLFDAEIQAAPASITVEAAPPATGTVGLPLPTAPTFAVRDAQGNILNSVPVTVSVTEGGGSVTNPPTLSGAAATSIGTWTLGTAAGTQSVTVSVAGIPSAVITTTAVAGPAANIVVVDGGGQVVSPGDTVPDPITVRVRDVFSNPIAGATVNWNVASGGGAILGGTSTVSNAEGIAAVPQWETGVCGGEQRLRGAVGSATGNVTVGLVQDFSLEVRWTSAQPTGVVKQAFDRACARVRQVIVADLTPVGFPPSFNANGCVTGLTINGETVFGLRIYAAVEPIDGPGSVLGSAGPCYTRTSNTLPVVGRMRFDDADLQNLADQGRLDAVIIHEMLHVIGVGTIWNAKGLKIGNAPETTPFFTGPLARSACIDDHAGTTVCGGGVPIEDCLNLTGNCGAGTINSHWKESVFRTELMTGFLNAGENPFSKMTMQSLSDMGYTVSLATQDAYTVPPPAFMSSIPAWTLRLPEPTLPIASIGENGVVTPWPQRMDR